MIFMYIISIRIKIQEQCIQKLPPFRLFQLENVRTFVFDR
jgi:hypothetical protein